MSASKSYSFELRKFAPGDFRKGIEQIRQAVFGSSSAMRMSYTETLPDGTFFSSDDMADEELNRICELTSRRTYYIYFRNNKSQFERTKISIHAEGDGYLSINVETEDINTLSIIGENLQTSLGLKPAPSWSERIIQMLPKEKPLKDLLSDLSARIAVIEHAMAAEAQSLTIFLSYQFNDPTKKYAREVRHFLDLLGIKIITGEGYEPKTVSEKVKDRLAQNIDAVILIEVASGKSSWTRDEIALAQSPGVFLIPLVEEGATFDKGIFGDHEYIEFSPGHIGDAFVKLLEGVNFVRRTKAVTVRRQPDIKASDEKGEDIQSSGSSE